MKIDFGRINGLLIKNHHITSINRLLRDLKPLFSNIWLISLIWDSLSVDFINTRNIIYICPNYGISIADCSIIRHSATPELDIPICKLIIPILVLKIILFYLKHFQYFKFSLNLCFFFSLKISISLSLLKF